MKRLLLNSLRVSFVPLFMIIICSHGCDNQTRSVLDTNYLTEVQDTNETNKVTQGEPDTSRQTDTIGSPQDTNIYKMVIKHNAPNQTQIDSIKKEKSKGKK